MRKKTQLLHTPPGSKPLYKEEALFRHTIEKKLCSYFEKWNFFPVETPMIDYFDVYAEFLTERQKRGSLRFVNRDGDLVILRNDITLFAAKALAARVTKLETTLKYYYSGQIVRCRAKDAPEEYYQIGCEIVGSAFTYEEIEILSILIESALDLGVTDFSLHIGDISLFDHLFERLTTEKKEEILGYIRVRDITRLRTALETVPLADNVKADCIKIASFIGSIDEFLALQLSDAGVNAAGRLKEIALQLKELGYADRVVVDLSELSELDYYNGIIFHLYAEGVEAPIASGGRYDHLFKELGLKKDAVGFSYWIYPVEKILNGTFEEVKDWQDIKIDKGNFGKAFKEGITAVRNGVKINLKY